MAIVEDYAGIAAELRRLRAKKTPENEIDAGAEPELQHRMRATPGGELLYRRLVSQRYWRYGVGRRPS